MLSPHSVPTHGALIMAVLLETSKGDLVIDLFVDECPIASKNFLKLCKCVPCRETRAATPRKPADGALFALSTRVLRLAESCSHSRSVNWGLRHLCELAAALRGGCRGWL